MLDDNSFDRASFDERSFLFGVLTVIWREVVEFALTIAKAIKFPLEG